MDEERSLFRAAASLTAVGFLSQGLGFFYRIALSRLVGAETLGLYHLIMPVYSVIQSVIMSGLAVALSSLSAGYLSMGNHKAVTQLLCAGLSGLVLLWVPIGAYVWRFSPFLAAEVLGDLRTRPGLVLLLPVLLLTGVENLHKHHFYGIGETRLPAQTELAEQFIRTAAILGLLTLLMPLPQSHAVAVIVLGMLVSEVFSAVTLWTLRRKREGRLSRQAGTGERPSVICRKLLSIAVPVSGAALVNNLISSANSILIPQKLVVYGLSEQEAMEEFGVVFGMTLPLVMLPFAIVNALCLVLLPRLTRCCALGDKSSLHRQASAAIRSISLTVFPILAALVTLGGEAGGALFHEPRVGDTLLPLAAVAALSAHESLFATILNAIGKQSASAAVSLLCGGVQLGFTLFGVVRWGFSACFVGMMVSSALGTLLRMRTALRSGGIHFSLFSCFISPALAAALAGSWTNLLRIRLEWLGYAPSLVLPVSFGVMLFLYGAALSVMGALPCRSFCISSSHSSTQRKRI